jgi:hypothetical protein
MAQMDGHVFICYSRKDEEFVIKLAKNLKRQGVPVWLDQWDIPFGANYPREIERALSDCTQLLLVLSPASVESDAVQSEWYAVLDKKKAVIPILHKNCNIPFRLKTVQYIDFTSRSPDDINDVLVALGKVESTQSRPPEISEQREQFRVLCGGVYGQKKEKVKTSQGIQKIGNFIKECGDSGGLEKGGHIIRLNQWCINDDSLTLLTDDKNGLEADRKRQHKNENPIFVASNTLWHITQGTKILLFLPRRPLEISVMPEGKEATVLVDTKCEVSSEDGKSTKIHFDDIGAWAFKPLNP